jgi:hypothetical protein
MQTDKLVDAYAAYSVEHGTYLGTFVNTEDVNKCWFRDLTMFFVKVQVRDDGRKLTL